MVDPGKREVMIDSDKACTRLLLIEDNKVHAQVVMRALLKGDAAFEIEVARSIAEGLALLRRKSFEVILSDLGLPDGNGMDVVRSLRREFERVPLVVLTGLEDERVAMQALDAGAQDFLSKSGMTGESLQRSIRYAMQRQQNSAMRRLVERLRTSRQMLQENNERLTELNNLAHQFVDNVSHEFRTPLTVIKEYVSLISEGIIGEVNDEQRRMLHTVEDRADDLNTMVDDMLDISKLEAGSLSVARKECTVQSILNHVYPNLDNKASLRNVRLEIDVADDLPPVYCDAEKAGRVIINLVVNAIKFCGDPGLVQIAVGRHESGEDLTIRIRDNGAGIEPAAIEKIFKRFTQVEADFYSRSTKGFGLGLSIAKELVQLNFGQIEVASTLGQGSEFSFSLPFNRASTIIERYLMHLRKMRRSPSSVTPIIVRLRNLADVTLSSEINSFLDMISHADELVFPLCEDAWLLVVPLGNAEAERFVAKTEEMHQKVSRNRPLGPLPELVFQLTGSYALDDVNEELALATARLAALADVEHGECTCSAYASSHSVAVL